MPATADNLRDLHLLHQRAKALRDRLASGPRTLAARQAALATRQAELEAAKKALQDSKVQLKKHEHSLKSVDTKIDDFKVKLNQVKKNEEYKALQNQIAHDNTAKSKIEEDMLLAYEVIETKTAEVKKLEDEVKRIAAEVDGAPATARRPGRRPQDAAPGAGNRHRRSRDTDPRGVPREIPADRRTIWGRCPGGLRECLLQWLFHFAYLSDDQRPHQRPGVCRSA